MHLWLQQTNKINLLGHNEVISSYITNNYKTRQNTFLTILNGQAKVR